MDSRWSTAGDQSVLATLDEAGGPVELDDRGQRAATASSAETASGVSIGSVELESARDKRRSRCTENYGALFAVRGRRVVALRDGHRWPRAADTLRATAYSRRIAAGRRDLGTL